MEIRAKIIAATPLITVIIYLLLGFCTDAWHPGWIIFLTIPVVEIFLPKNKVVFNGKNKQHKIFVYDEDDER